MRQIFFKFKEKYQTNESTEQILEETSRIFGLIDPIHKFESLTPADAEAKKAWDESVESIHAYISGDFVDTVIDDTVAWGIQDTEEANEFIQNAIKDPHRYVALDSETTGLYPRDGYMLGISLSYNGKCGAYIDTDCFDDRTEQLLQQLFY